MPAHPLRIAILSAHSCPVGKLGARDTGGMSVYIREVARELGELGHTIDVYTRIHDPRDRQTYELGPNARLVHLRAGEDEEINKLAIYPHLADFTHNLEVFQEQNGIVYDMIFSHYWLSGLVGECLRQRWGIPHMIMFHTLGAIKNDIGVGEIEPELRLAAERNLTQNCPRLIASTEGEKAELTLRYGTPLAKIGVVPCGVNLEQFRPLDKETTRRELGLSGRIILFVGRIDPLKGIDRLIESVSLITIPEIKLVIIGGDEASQPEIARLGQLARDRGVADVVSFPGPVKHQQLPSFYSAADVCAVSSYHESFGLVALESLACGTPVVATNVGNLRNIIREGETGYVLPDNDPTRLAEKISCQLARENSGGEYARSIRASVSRFGWDNIAAAIARECRRALVDNTVTVP